MENIDNMIKKTIDDLRKADYKMTPIINILYSISHNSFIEFTVSLQRYMFNTKEIIDVSTILEKNGLVNFSNNYFNMAGDDNGDDE